jgi:folate-dependent tRNA-U54 methylase TrmFO/GidA
MTRDESDGRRAQKPFTGVKVFSATMAVDRARLGEQVTAWLADHPSVNIVDVAVTQSSDEAFHCLAITLFFVDEG